MTDNKFLNLYKSGAIGLVLTAAAQIWLAIKTGDASLFATGAATLAGVVLPAIAGKRLDTQIKSGALEQLDPLDAITQNIPVVIERANSAAADIERLRGATAEVLGNIPVYGDEVEQLVKGIRF